MPLAPWAALGALSLALGEARAKKMCVMLTWIKHGTVLVIYHPVNVYIAIQHGPFQLIYLFKIVIFRSYVSLPEGILDRT